jgi:putative addiction module killer protein
MYQVQHYKKQGGFDEQIDVYTDWLKNLKDANAKIAIVRRVARMELGNFGDHKFCRDGVWELRVDAGPGYRIYYALANQTVVLLLCGGDKRSQRSDIERACKYWQDWQT